MSSPPAAAPLRLRLDGEALASNWRWLNDRSGEAACGAAIKANGYGLGARQVMERLAAAGCRDFFVATWAEALALTPLPEGVSLSVLHGVRTEDIPVALSGFARPVLNTPEQVSRWREAGGGLCDVMIDTGINRLGLDWRQDCAALTQEMTIHTLMSHLACADEDHALNAMQRDRLVEVAQGIKAERLSLANSAGICLGDGYHFGLTRPGLALYGGIPRAEAVGAIGQVVFPQAQILQRRTIQAGDTAGYSATFTAGQDVEAAILNLGYADGYLRGFSGRGAALVDGQRLPVIGRVSMDLLIVDVSARPDLVEGDWVDIDYDLRTASAQSGLSHYELLTGLGARYERAWS